MSRAASAAMPGVAILVVNNHMVGTGASAKTSMRTKIKSSGQAAAGLEATF